MNRVKELDSKRDDYKDMLKGDLELRPNFIVIIIHDHSGIYLRLVVPGFAVTCGNCVEMSFVIRVDPGIPVAGKEVKKSQLTQ